MADFLTGQLADDLVKTSIDLCGRKQDKCAKFPKYLYLTYIDMIMNTSLEIQKSIFLANESYDKDERFRLQRNAISNCTYLNHLIRISYDYGWISEKQRDRWQKLCTSVKFKVINWSKANK